RITGLYLFQIAKTLWPRGNIFFGIVGKHSVHCAYHTFSPLVLFFQFHTISLDYLDQAMEAQHSFFHTALDQREAEEGFHQVIEGEAISDSLLERRWPLRRTFYEQFFGDGIRSKKGAEVQQLSGCWVVL